MSGQTGRMIRFLPWAAGLIAFAFFQPSISALSKNVGFYHDELWDYIPAVGMMNGESLAGNQEVRLFHHPVPLVTGPYQGALKTWISGPLLPILGTSPRALRTLNVAYAMVFLAALYWALLPAAGRWAALVFAAPFVDTNFLVTAPIDMGPSLFQFVFISLALGALFRYLSQPQVKYYWMACFFAGCILAQKLTAFPVVLSILLVAAVLSFRSFRAEGIKRLLRNGVLIPAGLFLVPLLPHLLYFQKAGLEPLFTMTADGVRLPYFESLKINFVFFSNMFDGSDWYQRITLDSLPPSRPPLLIFWGLGVMTASTLLCLFPRLDRRLGKFALTATATGLLSFLLMPAFRGLSRPWHFYILEPLFLAGSIVAGIHVLWFVAGLFDKRRTVAAALLGLIVFSGIAASAYQGVAMVRRFELRPGMCMMSPSINRVYESMKKADIKTLYAINYSMAYPIYVLSRGAVHVEEFCWQDLNQDTTGELMQKVKSVPGSAILYRYCGCKVGDPENIRWLNRDPQIGDFIKRVEAERPAFHLTSCRDNLETEFVLITADRDNR